MVGEDLSCLSQVTIFLSFLLILEYMVARLRDFPTVRMNDCLQSFSAALIAALPRLLFTSLDTVAYSVAYYTLYNTSCPGSSSFLWDWLLVFLLVDFGYYWFHRAAHEINILWAAHQVHHSSEDFNISVSLRQSVVQQFVTWIFYIPLALIGINPSSFKTHLWFSCLYQMWTHTEVVNNLGPLEYIFVTPAHHRVHHGRNPYCIDRNYGGILIIWDRIFGTFVEEKKGNKPVYGLVVNRVDDWNPIWTQISQYSHLLKSFWETPGISNKFFVLFNGPSWSPGKPRLGNGTYEEPEYPVIKYDRTLPLPIRLYIIGHFGLVLFMYYKHLEISQSCSVFQTIGVIVYLLFALTTFGTLFDHKRYGPIMEAVRCIAYLVIHSWNNKYESKQIYVGIASTLTVPTSGFIHSIFIMSLVICFTVETMKINWTGSESAHHENKIKHFSGEQSYKQDINTNTISNIDILDSCHTK